MGCLFCLGAAYYPDFSVSPCIIKHSVYGHSLLLGQYSAIHRLTVAVLDIFYREGGREEGGVHGHYLLCNMKKNGSAIFMLHTNHEIYFLKVVLWLHLQYFCALQGADDDLLKVWSSETGQLLATLRGHSAEVTDVSLSNDNTMIASGSLDKSVRVWCAQSSASLAVLTGHQSHVTSVQFSPSPVEESRCIHVVI